MTDNNQEKQQYGYDLYPQRRSDEAEMNYWQKYFSIRSRICANHLVCEENVVKAIKKNPVIKTLIGALKSAGCPINLKRHIVCEECDNQVTGGYDSEYNQIIICQNSGKSRRTPEAVLAHELVHMYDYCTNEVDFKNLEHLACTEIRAANLSHCSFLSSFLLGQSSFINVKKTHQYCVKMKAAQSIMLGRGVDFSVAIEAVLKVFNKCYNDLEPLGRRIKRNSDDGELAYKESVHFGYCSESKSS